MNSLILAITLDALYFRAIVQVHLNICFLPEVVDQAKRLIVKSVLSKFAQHRNGGLRRTGQIVKW
jgi:hypothetical protein